MYFKEDNEKHVIVVFKSGIQTIKGNGEGITRNQDLLLALWSGTT